MSSVPSEYVVRRAFRPSFYFWIAFVMAAYVFGGFSLAALHRYVTNDPTTMPPVVHLHGVTFISWMTLLMVQTWLINVKNVALHRSLGTFGIALGTAVLFTGALIALLGFSRPGGSGSPFYYDLMYLSVMALLGFGFLFTFAIRQARNPENHRRLILFATIPLLPPGINRTYQVLFELNYLPVVGTYLTMAAIAAAILAHDWRANGKIHFASKIGAAVVFGQMLLHFPITRSQTFHEVAGFLTSLVYYR
jgi:hypothetical protein